MSENQTVESVDLARLRELESRARSKHYYHAARADFREELEIAFPSLLARIERLEAENADLRHDVERAVASASDLATELVRKDAALREALPFVESTYENESGEEAADAKYVMDKITAALEQSNG
jgi:hypothetical protein